MRTVPSCWKILFTVGSSISWAGDLWLFKKLDKGVDGSLARMLAVLTGIYAHFSASTSWLTVTDDISYRGAHTLSSLCRPLHTHA